MNTSLPTPTGTMTDDPEISPPGSSEPTPAERAAAEAAKAAKKARKAQEKAERLAAEAARLASTDEPGQQPLSVPDPQLVSSRTPLLVAVVALVACVAFLVVALVVYVRDDSPGAAPATAARDAALLAARQDIVVLNSLDYRNVDEGLSRWLAASTGQLHASFEHITAADRKRITDAKSVTTARILEAAVTSLSAVSGHATVIASVELTVTPSTGKAVIKRERQQADVDRVGGVWKVSSLQQVGVTVR
jgi:Mce-associated membrane protein